MKWEDTQEAKEKKIAELRRSIADGIGRQVMAIAQQELIACAKEADSDRQVEWLKVAATVLRFATKLRAGELRID